MNNMNKKRTTVYKGSAKNWTMMMNKIYGPNCKFTAADYMRQQDREE